VRQANLSANSYIALALIVLVLMAVFVDRVMFPAASDDAQLRMLAISEGTLTPAFDPEEDAYTASVANAVDEVVVSAVPKHPVAAVTIGNVYTPEFSRTVALEVGANEVPVVVVAEDGVSSETYTITITRADP
jgi:trimeric autotransporter adhesin